MNETLKQFKEAREKLGLSISDVTLSLRIGEEYIIAIENARFDVLPEPVYAIGFIKTYAKFLELPYDDAVLQYKIASGITKNIAQSPCSATPLSISELIIFIKDTICKIQQYLSRDKSDKQTAPYD